jgi:hypothetical protein
MVPAGNCSETYTMTAISQQPSRNVGNDCMEAPTQPPAINPKESRPLSFNIYELVMASYYVSLI